MANLIVGHITIAQDEYGRYRLNDLHKASEFGSDKTKLPKNWTRQKSVQELRKELENQGADLRLALEVIHGGDNPGTYAHEILAIEYAGWLSPAFRILVNQAFIDSRTPNTKPEMFNPTNQQMIDMIYRQDATERQLAETTAVAHQAQQTALQAIHGQQWLTVRQYVAVFNLTRQLPPGTAQQQYGRYLTGYCQEHNLPVYKEKAIGIWKEENTYWIKAIQNTIEGWLARRAGQVSYLPHDKQAR